MVAKAAHQRKQNARGISAGLLRTAAVVLLIALGAATVFCAWVFDRRLQHLYRANVHPNVTAMGVPLGGLTLAGIQDYPEVDTLILRDGEKRWSVPWQEVGLALDSAATAKAAYDVGRDELTLVQRLQSWVGRHEVPAVYSVDLTQARGVLEQLAPEASTPPVDAGVRLDGEQAVIVPGKAGRVLDVTATLASLDAVPAFTEGEVTVDLTFRDVEPVAPDLAGIQDKVEALLARSLSLEAYEVLTGEMLRWTLGRAEIAPWLKITPADDGSPVVAPDPDAVQATLEALAAELGDGRGFRYEEATQQLLDAFEAGGGKEKLYLTHPERVYTVQPGDTLTTLSIKLGMPPGLVAEANSDIDIDKLSVGQAITIPSQDLLTPYMPIPNKKIVINLDAQRMRVYEDGALLYEWTVSTGLPDSPTHRGTFQIVSKEERAYGSQWDLWMPYFMAIYPAGGVVYNGIHELPILANGQRLWAGTLGRPASFGCVILGIPDAETLFQWAELGVVVVIE